MLYPSGNTVKMLNIRHIPPRFASGPPPPPISEEDSVVQGFQKASLNDDDYDGAPVPPPVPELPVKWEVSIGSGKRKSPAEDLIACTMGAGGDLIVAVGAKGGIWLWKRILETTS